MRVCKYRENAAVKRATHCGAVMEARDDIALLGAIAQQRDHAAFTELYERYQKRVFNLTLRILHNRILAEDAMQEAMLSIWHSAKSFQPNEDAANWILRIVANKSIDLKRSKERSAKREGVVAMEPRNQETTVSLQVEKEELMATLRSHLDRLPKLESELLACCYGARMSHQEIADKFDISRTRVTRKIQDALDRLQGSLSKAGVAAVVPLIGAEKLFEAMTTGVDCPPGMTAKILQHIANSETKVPRTFRRRTTTVTPGARVGAWVAFAVTAVAAALALSIGTRPATPAPPRTIPVAADETFNYSWNFEKGPPRDLQVSQGSWQWIQKDKQSPGFMQVPANAQLSVDLPSVSAQPFLVTLKFTPGNGDGGSEGACWQRNEKTLRGMKTWVHPHEFAQEGGPYVEHLYFIDRYVIGLLDHGNESGLVVFLVEYNDPYPAQHPIVYFKNMEVGEIAMRSLRPDELPASLKDPQKLTEGMALLPK
jgi:RNA polymerase sigma-70 factor (ECF subfamily)